MIFQSINMSSIIYLILLLIYSVTSSSNLIRNQTILEESESSSTLDLLEAWSPLAARVVGRNRALRSSMRSPRSQVTETDIYLLGAIEKLVERVDLLESRLRRAEMYIYNHMNFNGQKPNASKNEYICRRNGSRILNTSGNCVEFIQDSADWKVAGNKCKLKGGKLAEFDTMDDVNGLITFMKKDKNLNGKTWWTGGFNPGLLWLWSGSARPVPGMNEIGTDFGRCLSLNRSGCRPESCAKKLPVICQFNENPTIT